MCQRKRVIKSQQRLKIMKNLCLKGCLLLQENVSYLQLLAQWQIIIVGMISLNKSTRSQRSSLFGLNADNQLSKDIKKRSMSFPKISSKGQESVKPLQLDTSLQYEEPQPFQQQINILRSKRKRYLQLADKQYQMYLRDCDKLIELKKQVQKKVQLKAELQMNLEMEKQPERKEYIEEQIIYTEDRILRLTQFATMFEENLDFKLEASDHSRYTALMISIDEVRIASLANRLS